LIWVAAYRANAGTLDENTRAIDDMRSEAGKSDPFMFSGYFRVRKLSRTLHDETGHAIWAVQLGEAAGEPWQAAVDELTAAVQSREISVRGRLRGDEESLSCWTSFAARGSCFATMRRRRSPPIRVCPDLPGT
jgi:hypothetical protein